MISMENRDFLSSQLITYIGNKRKLLGFIQNAVEDSLERLGKDKAIILDGFSGSGVVSRLLKSHSSLLHSNDLELYSRIGNSCYLSNQSEIDMAKIKDTIRELNEQKLREMKGGFIEKLYAPADDDNIQENERVFYTNKNAKIIDNLRRLIIDQPEPQYFLAPLLFQASVHTNTSGVFKGFYKNSQTKKGQFGGNGKNALSRIMGEITLPVPIFSQNECEYKIHQKDTNELVRELEVDITYFDPPYNQHPYGSNYFMLNLISEYDEPGIMSKISGIPENWNKSNYNTRSAADSFRNLIEFTNSKIIIISYNNEGIISSEIMMKILEKWGRVSIREIDYNTFRGSRNLANRNLKTKERLFILEKK